MRTDMAVLLGILGVAVLSMGVFVLTGGRTRPDPHDVKDRGSFVLGDFSRRWFYWFVRPVEATALALGLHPTAFNLAGVAFGAVAGGFFATDHLVLGGWSVLLGGIADVLDGRIARARGLADERGAFLDSTLDRFAEFGALVGLAVWFADRPLPLVLTATALGASLIVSYARARGEVEGVLCTRGVMQRAERLLALGFGGLLDSTLAGVVGTGRPGDFLAWAVGLVAVGTVGTAVYRTVWIARRLSNETPQG